MLKSIVSPIRWLSVMQAYVLLWKTRWEIILKGCGQWVSSLKSYSGSLFFFPFCTILGQILRVLAFFPSSLCQCVVDGDAFTCILSTSRKVAIWKAFSQSTRSLSSSTLNTASSPVSICTLKHCRRLSNSSVSWNNPGSKYGSRLRDTDLTFNATFPSASMKLSLMLP